MPSAGQLTSDQTFLTFAVRHEVMFYHAQAAVGAPITSPYGMASFTTAEQLAIWAMNSCTFQFQVSAKIEFEGPVCMTPAGAGPNGQVNGATNVAAGESKDSLITNGVPQAPSIYTLPLPVAITKRQGIAMIEKKFTLGAVDIVGEINLYTGGKLFRAYIDGYNTRDVL